MLRKEIRKCILMDSSTGILQGYFLPPKAQNRTVIRSSSKATAELLSPENRNRCVECMKKAPNVGNQLKDSRSDENRFAAVLIAVCLDPQNVEPSILYTRRSANLSRHTRQISFPGGLKDESDADFVECALRETEEEIGLPRDRVEIWGTGLLLTPPRTAAITPVLGTVRDFNLSDLKLNPSEVEEAFTLPIQRLVAPDSLHYTQFKTGYSSPVFIFEKYKLWGITAYLTHMFLNCFVPNITTKRVKYIRPYKQETNR